jgi:hypothetical protein
MTSLEEIIKYRHPQVIRRFCKEHPEMAINSDLIFEDLMRFFWASKCHEEDKKQYPQKPELDFIYIMDEEMKGIDQMWHVFLLYTQDYSDFCYKYFGKFLHHLPDLVDPEPTQADTTRFETNLEKFLSYTYDVLGEDVIRRWYAPVLAEN